MKTLRKADLAFILFICFLFFFVHSNASENKGVPRITITFDNQSLDSALCQLEKVSERRFIYQDKIINVQAKINQKFEDKTLLQILGVLFENLDYSYVYVSGREAVVIYKKTTKLPQATGQECTSSSTTGVVVDEEGKPVQAVSVYVIEDDDFIMKNTNCFTDKDGSFTIPTTNPNACVVVLYIGYLPRIVHIKDAELIRIEPDLEMLNKVITIGN
ncbi:MAG: carboxypeptidase-like regulatory domain-containing protein [Dysgonamonadaceae bacterium]|jgi:hypothetical protein|nr:carboxypeptidase-like regulatory domain-containing protein [Dysgonamonadaceae bacterium]